MKDDPLSELLRSPLDDQPLARTRRAWITIGAALLVAALVAIVVVVWGGRRSDDGESSTTAAAEGASTTVAAGGASTTATVGGSSTSAAEGMSTTTQVEATAGYPEDRVYAHLVATSAGILLFGGLDPVQHLNGVRFDDVWRYDGATGEWWEIEPSGGPVPRAGAAMAYDAGSGVVVLFGGAIGSCAYPSCSENLDDTWVYDPAASTWEQRSPAASPPARHGHTLAYDAQSDRVVLFGGDTGAQWLNDTWAYDTDTDTWVEVPTAEAPRPVAQQAMAYDPVADLVVLWGGAEREDSEVWTFDLEAAAWASLTPDPSPEPAWDACLVWEAASEQMLLIGGEGPTTVQISEAISARVIGRRNEVWALDLQAGTWALLGRLPEPVAAHACATDAESATVLIWNADTMLLVDPVTGSGLVDG
jgi:N-acetylneuraminic acid mutarotase